MNINEYTSYTNQLLTKLSRDNSTFNLKPQIIENIKNITTNHSESPRTKVVDYKGTSGPDFKIPSSVSSIPYISEIGEGNNITLKTIEPATYKMKTESRVSNSINPARIRDFRDEIPAINKAAFSRGLNLDSFTVLNIGRTPLNRDALKFLTKNGAILPLSSGHGVFIPEFALKDATFNSIEYESRFSSRSSIDWHGSFDDIATKLVKTDFGINLKNILTHNVDNTFASRLTYDSSIANRAGAVAKEVVIGSAPLSNLITGINAIFSSWDKRNAIPAGSKIMDKSAGIHVNTSVNGLTNSNYASASQYINHAGIIIGALSRNKTRWQSENYLGIRSKYDENRADFRLSSSTNRLECRYPGTIFDISHITDQLIMANKINHDVSQYLRHNNLNGENLSQISGYGTALSGNERKATGTLSALHDQSHPEHNMMNQWFDSFMTNIGITNEFSKKFVKAMNAKCLRE